MSIHELPCPTCRRPVILASNPDRPFCSERCRLIDLGAWASEEYSMPGGSSSVLSADTDEPYEE